MDTKKLIKYGSCFLGIALLVVIYKVFNPYNYNFFPKCPFRTLTGYECPGCGSQRAIHFLLNGDLTDAFRENALLVISIPYLLLGFIFDLNKNPNVTFLKWRKRLFGKTAIYIILAIIIGFWVLRNVF